MNINTSMTTRVEFWMIFFSYDAVFLYDARRIVKVIICKKTSLASLADFDISFIIRVNKISQKTTKESITFVDLVLSDFEKLLAIQRLPKFVLFLGKFC